MEFTTEKKVLSFNEGKEVEVEFTFEDFCDIISQYERVKYGDRDFQQRPDKKKLIDELIMDLQESLEELDDFNDETLVIGYVNQDLSINHFISFQYNYHPEVGSVKFFIKDEWMENI